VSAAAGFSMIELAVVTSLAATMAAIAMPSIAAALEEARTRSAVRYVTSLLERIRMDAIARSANIALRFERDRAFQFSVYADRNGNGVLTHDISEGVDIRLNGPERLADHFAEVRFEVAAGLPPVEIGADATTSDPVRTGGTDVLVFTPRGTATAASLYIRGPGGRQYVIRVFGDTGRVRSLRFDARRRVWLPL
jgi:type II secretory pathway pseudopilin PulG